MRTNLSSEFTHLSKWVLPLAFRGGLILLLVQMLRHSHEQAAPDYWFAAIWGAGAILACCYGLWLKHVSLDENFLYVSNYRGEVSFPLSSVCGVKEWSIPLSLRLIFVYVSEPSGYVRTIIFQAPLASYFSLRESQTFLELRRIVRQNQEAN
jgi:hypothetical protein